MISAYFAPTWAPCSGASRGVGKRGRARIDHRGQIRQSMRPSPPRASPIRRLLNRGVEVFEYQPTKLHSKLVVVDDVVHIGSSNFDIRSLYLNMELMLRVDDRVRAA